MYRLGERRRLYKRYLAAAFISIVVAAVSLFVLSTIHPKSQTNISTSPIVVSRIANDKDTTIRVDENLFSLELPKGWKDSEKNIANGKYAYRGTSGNDKNRLIEIYMDNLPETLAVNRLVALQPQANTFGHGTVSDNCINFTSQEGQSTEEAQRTKIVPATWQNVNFLCDIGNYNRNVVGASAGPKINTISLISPGAKRSFFFTYTEQNFNPDYTVFYDMLETFKLK